MIMNLCYYYIPSTTNYEHCYGTIRTFSRGGVYIITSDTSEKRARPKVLVGGDFPAPLLEFFTRLSLQYNLRKRTVPFRPTRMVTVIRGSAVRLDFMSLIFSRFSHFSGAAWANSVSPASPSGPGCHCHPTHRLRWVGSNVLSSTDPPPSWSGWYSNMILYSN